MFKHKFFLKATVVLTLIALLAACGGGGATETPNGEQAQSTPEAAAAEYPAKPITIIVPFPAGGISDLNARAFADAASEFTDQRIVIENVGGGSGTIGNYQLTQRDPDGYTWLWGASGHMSSTLHITEAPYTMEDFTVVNKVGQMTSLLMVSKDSPFQTMNDFYEYAKQNPGGIEIGNPGDGTVVGLLARQLEKSLEVDVEHIPFEGSGPALSALMGGHIQSALMNVTEVRGQIESGNLRALAALSAKRVDVVPDVPTVVEQGFPEVSGGASHYIVIPNGVPADIQAQIDAFTQKVYNSAKFKDTMNKAGFQLDYMAQADALQELKQWYETSEELYRLTGQLK